MSEIVPLIPSNWIKVLWIKLSDIRKNREEQIRRISDIVGDPFRLAEYYVEPKCQQNNPADHNEIEPISYVRCLVFTTIYDFFKRDFAVFDGRNQMFVLADAGMGKTSLLAMLKLAHLTSFWPEKMNCELLKLGQNSITIIEAIPDKRNTVLLLDALDEDPSGFGKVEKRLIEILSATQHFRRVVISCRTQYFPSGGDDPFERKGHVVVGGFNCPVIYLSLFDEDQVDEYLQKRFANNDKKREKAKAVLSKMESLRFRPLLLSHIEDIIESETANWNEYSIYYALVRAWLQREQTKLLRRKGGQSIKAEDLWQACIKIAKYMQLNGKRHITEKELEGLISESPELKHLKYFDVGGRSLLNRNSNGEYRFSHYTTQEFLIAYAVVAGAYNENETQLRATDQILFFLNLASGGFLKFGPLDLSHCDLTRLNLKRADMRNGVFIEANIQDGDLSGARIDNANLIKANLKQATFNQSSLTGSVLRETVLEGARFAGVDLSKSDLRDVKINECIFEQTDFKYADLTGVDFTNVTLKEVDFSFCNLSRVNLNGVNLCGASLAKAILTKALLANANLNGCDLKQADLREADLRQAKIDNVQLEGAKLQGANLQGVDFRKVNLKNVELRGVDLKNSILENFDVKIWIESGMPLKNAELKNYDLRLANLSGADLSDADLSGVDLYRANFFQADLCGADLSDANIEQANFIGAYYSKATRFPPGFSPYCQGLILRSRKTDSEENGI